MLDRIRDARRARWMTPRVEQIITGAILGDTELIDRAAHEIDRRYGEHGGYLTCCTLAETIAAMGRYPRPRAGMFFSFRVGDAHGPVDPDQLDPQNRPIVHGLRFVVSYLNDGVGGESLAVFRGLNTAETGPVLLRGLAQMIHTHARQQEPDGWLSP